jgi:hypothetical protein
MERRLTPSERWAKSLHCEHSRPGARSSLVARSGQRLRAKSLLAGTLRSGREAESAGSRRLLRGALPGGAAWLTVPKRGARHLSLSSYRRQRGLREWDALRANPQNIHRGSVRLTPPYFLSRREDFRARHENLCLPESDLSTLSVRKTVAAESGRSPDDRPLIRTLHPPRNRICHPRTAPLTPPHAPRLKPDKSLGPPDRHRSDSRMAHRYSTVHPQTEALCEATALVQTRCDLVI